MHSVVVSLRSQSEANSPLVFACQQAFAPQDPALRHPWHVLGSLEVSNLSDYRISDVMGTARRLGGSRDDLHTRKEH